MNIALPSTLSKDDLVSKIRASPLVYLGKRSLTALAHFVDGFSYCLEINGVQQTNQEISWHDWTAYRLGFYEATSGYANMILSKEPDEAKALDMFFTLHSEFQKRLPCIVATKKILRPPIPTLTGSPERAESDPTSLSNFDLIVYANSAGEPYTQHQGFFADWRGSHEIGGGFTPYFPNMSVFVSRTGLKVEEFEVLRDPDMKRLTARS